MSYVEPVLRSGCKQSVRFRNTFCCKIIYHNTYVRFIPPQIYGLFTESPQCCIYSRQNTLTRRFFVTRGSVKVTRMKESPYLLRLKGRIKLRWRYHIVLYGVCGFKYFNPFKTRNGSVHLYLDIFRKGCGQTVGIYLYYICAFRFKENEMFVLIGKSYYLVFNGRTVSRSYTFYQSPVKGGFIQILPYYLMGLLRRIGYPARYLFFTLFKPIGSYRIRPEGKLWGWIVTRGYLKTRKVNGSFVKSCRGSRFKSY